MSDRRTRTNCRREEGIALMLSVLLLVAVSALALSTMQTAASDGTVAGFQNQEQIAFYAAEAGIADARAVIRNMGERSEVPDYPADFPDEDNPEELSNPSEFETGDQPIYYADPNPPTAAPIMYVGEGAPCTEGCNMTLGGLKFNHTKWQVNVVGESPSGDQKRLEVVATRLLAVGY
ncbi:MAG: pilus assembly PilX N-terminal domain-containing protein [bacterium]|nr:pilus assembly PilX N-terminal domain-containing protein [bacterium]